MIATLFALALSATSPQASAFSHGFSARSLAQASPGIDVASTRAALTRMEALRALLILGPARTTIRLDPMEARALAAALGRFDGPGGKSIAWFMRGAITRVGVFDGRYVAGFYNPLVDAWLIAPLAVVGGEFVVLALEVHADARVRAGQQVREDA